MWSPDSSLRRSRPRGEGEKVTTDRRTVEDRPHFAPLWNSEGRKEKERKKNRTISLPKRPPLSLVSLLLYGESSTRPKIILLLCTVAKLDLALWKKEKPVCSRPCNTNGNMKMNGTWIVSFCNSYALHVENGMCVISPLTVGKPSQYLQYFVQNCSSFSIIVHVVSYTLCYLRTIVVIEH